MVSSNNTDGQNNFALRASQLGELVLEKRDAIAARQYLGWIASLGTSFYKAPRELLETALVLAVRDFEKYGDKKDIRAVQENYEFFRDVAKLYGLKEAAERYEAKVQKYATKVKSHRGINLEAHMRM